MPNNWKTYRLSEAPIEIIDGDRGKNYPNSSEFTKEGHCLFLSAKNVTNTGFKFSEKSFISKERDNLLRKGKLKRYDIVLTTRGTVGNIAYFGDNIPHENIRINSGMVIIRADRSFINERYLYLTLSSQGFANQVLNNRTGSAQPQLPIRDLKTLEISIPPLSKQNAIASILFALDYKIELNLQTNKTLEEMAMTLYKHWFVDFGPFKNGEFVDSELGKIPKGWEVKRIDTITNFIDPHPSHRAPKIEMDGYPFAGIGDIDEMGNVNYLKARSIGVEAVDKQQESYNIKNTSIGFGRVGTVGKVIRLRPQAFRYALSPTMAVINSFKEEYSEFSYYVVKSDNFLTQVYNNQTGSTRPTIGIQTLRALKVVLPNDVGLIVKFKELVKDLYRKGDSLNSENQTLTTLRDTLLPKLISGEVRVKDVEKILSEVL